MTRSMTPNQYAAEYEFRGDGGDYTPTDGERTMIEDAIHGYLGQFDEPTSAERSAVGVKEGWQLVPKTMTHDMLSRLANMPVEQTSRRFTDQQAQNEVVGYERAEAIYSVLLAAAPVPPVLETAEAPTCPHCAGTGDASEKGRVEQCCACHGTGKVLPAPDERMETAIAKFIEQYDFGIKTLAAGEFRRALAAVKEAGE
jgi:hypothetical protein